MARPLRIELSGGLYHVTSRGDGREDIYFSDADRRAWLELCGRVCERFNWLCHAYCQMTNHYHMVVETPEANLALGMRKLNGVDIASIGVTEWGSCLMPQSPRESERRSRLDPIRCDV